MDEVPQLPRAARPSPSSNVSNVSRYDYIKVRVWLGGAVERESVRDRESAARCAPGDVHSSSPLSSWPQRSVNDAGAESTARAQPRHESQSMKQHGRDDPIHRHYYVLSRFLISRTLTSILIPPHDAVVLSLDLKKHLVDNDKFDIEQENLEELLFMLMRKKGYGSKYEESYRAMTTFHHNRTPLIILVGGSYCTGKSTIASKLAQRMNLPNVLQTDMLADLLRDPPSHRCAPAGADGDGRRGGIRAEPLWSTVEGAGQEGRQASTAMVASSSSACAEAEASHRGLIDEFTSECDIVLRGLAGNIEKAVMEGKSIIIEGIHLDMPSIMRFIHSLYERGDGDTGRRPTGKAIVVPILLTANYYCTKATEDQEMAAGGYVDDTVEKWMETRRAEMEALGCRAADVIKKDMVVVRTT